MYAWREDSIKIPYICLDPLAVALQSMNVNNTLSDERKIRQATMCRFRHRKHYSGDTTTPKLHASNGISGPDTRAYVHRKHPVPLGKTAAEVASLIVTQKHRSHTRGSRTASRKRHFESPPLRET